ncbi:MAG: hypothetical protein OEV64_02045 [Desulfobulbaceae bacterium]|nr:hypothetical protein [Desulfobulbaceae bacterium]
MNCIKAELDNIFQSLVNLSDNDILYGSNDLFRPHLDKLNILAAIDLDDSSIDELFNDSDLKIVISRISHVKRLNSMRIEIDCARSIIESDDPWSMIMSFYYYKNYLNLARMESEGAGLQANNKVIFLGSGPLPLSLIMLYKYYKVKGIGIELKDEFVQLSRDVVAALGMDHNIKVVCGDHYSFPLDVKCELVMVGAEALPKDEIFAHLAKVVDDQTKVSYRIFEKGFRRLLDDKSCFLLPPIFREYARVHPEPPVNNTVVFAVKDCGHVI